METTGAGLFGTGSPKNDQTSHHSITFCVDLKLERRQQYGVPGSDRSDGVFQSGPHSASTFAASINGQPGPQLDRIVRPLLEYLPVRFFSLPVRPAQLRRTRLGLQTLEGREVPAGVVTATLSPTGVLSIVGDHDDNGFTLTVNSTTISLVPDGTTTLNIPSPLIGTVKSIKADLKGGDDTAVLDPTAIFEVPGAVNFLLGDGNNTLDLTTNQAILLGSLTVKGGDGSDMVTVQGGIAEGSRVNGAASFIYANGGSETTLGDIDFGVGVKLTTGDGVSVPNNLAATTVNVTKIFSVDLGNSNPGLASFNDCTLGGLKLSGQVVGAVFTGSNVNGSVTLKGGFQADVEMDTTTVTKHVSLKAATATFGAEGDASLIMGNLTVTGSSFTQTSFQSTGPTINDVTEVRGNITVKGGWFNDSFETNGQFRAGKNVSLTLNGGDNLVSIGDATADPTIVGSLKIKTGAGADTIQFSRLAVTGITSILTFAGADTLSIEDNSSFATTFTADLGSGDDTISIGQNASADAGEVFFTGSTKILAGIGNDTLLLGLNDGDPDSRVRFLGAVNTVDGGDGIDSFNVGAGDFVGVSPTGWNP
jgi:hypothetical protein